MKFLDKLLKSINFIQYCMAFYSLFVSKKIDYGIFLTIISLVVSLFIKLNNSRNSFINKYNNMFSNNKISKHFTILSIIFIIFELQCMILCIIYDRFYYSQNEISIIMAAIFYTMWIVAPIIYTISTDIFLSLVKKIYYIKKIFSIIIYFPTMIWVVYSYVTVLNFKEVFWIQVLIYWFGFSIPSLLCSIVISKKH